MLSKLLGYEMKAYSRIMLPIFAALMAFSIGIGFSIRFLPRSAMDNFIFIFAMIIYAMLFAAVVFATIVMVILRFYNNVLGREGYLMMSLPVKTNTLLVSKILSSFIWVVIGTVVGFLAVIVTAVISVNSETLPTFDQVKHFIGMVWDQISAHPYALILWILVLIGTVCARVMRVYAAASVGSRWNGHRLIGSILAYIAFVTIEVILINIMNHFELIKNAASSADMAEPAFLWVILAVVAVEYAVYHIVSWFVVDRRLNLE